MTRDDVVRILREHLDELHAFGAREISLFGSFGRGEPRLDSDVDMLVEFDKETPDFRQHMGLLVFLEELLERRVDLATPRMLRPELEAYVRRDLYRVA